MDIFIYNYRICKNTIDLIVPGGIVTLSDEKDIKTFKNWVKEVRKAPGIDLINFLNFQLKYVGL